MPKLDLLRQTHAGVLRRCQLRSLTRRRWPLSFSIAHAGTPSVRLYSQDVDRRSTAEEINTKASETTPSEPEPGAMSRLLEEMTEDSLTANPRRSDRMVKDAGFSEDLKRKLEERIASGKIAPEHQQAASVASMPSSAGEGTRDLAEAVPWKGSEKMEDTALRMLEDAHKPLRGSHRRPIKLAPVDMRPKNQSKDNRGERLANARDKSSIYSLSQDNGMTENEREEMRRIFKERFQPGARSVPATIQGLQSLASERIEDAIARGQFKNIPRGKGVNVERDYMASSPFLDTTEYFMNKIIQKQEVLPPWVEKQQEVTRTIATFRARLRNDWKRHAARVIASRGGTLEQQIRRAERYAAAEAQANPRAAKTETLASIDLQGNLTKVSVTETPPEAQHMPLASEASTITVTEEFATAVGDSAAVTEESAAATAATPPGESSASPPLPTPPPSDPLPAPFRDPAWEQTELSYHTLALTQLNNLTRSYNLMAPELARKPYFRLDRELRNCYADIAPLLPAEIKLRARAPPNRPLHGAQSHRQGGVLEKFSQSEKVRVWESTRPKYGLKEFWKDLFGAKKGQEERA